MCLTLPHFFLMIEINPADKITTKPSPLSFSSSESVNIACNFVSEAIFTLKNFFFFYRG